MESSGRETVRWGQLDSCLENLKTLMQIWDDFLHELKSHPNDPEARERYMETLHTATSCVVNKAIEVREGRSRQAAKTTSGDAWGCEELGRGLDFLTEAPVKLSETVERLLGPICPCQTGSSGNY